MRRGRFRGQGRFVPDRGLLLGPGQDVSGRVWGGVLWIMLEV
jgi:hypothetical protein